MQRSPLRKVFVVLLLTVIVAIPAVASRIATANEDPPRCGDRGSDCDPFAGLDGEVTFVLTLFAELTIVVAVLLVCLALRERRRKTRSA